MPDLNGQWQVCRALGWTLLVLCIGSMSSARADEMRTVKKQAAPQGERKAEAKAPDEKKADEKKADEKKADEKKAAAGDRAADPKKMAAALRKKLLSRAELSADKVPLNQLVEKLAKTYDIPLRIDEKALKEAGIAIDVPISAEVKKGTLNTVLKRALSGAGLRALIRDDEVLITKRDPDAPADENKAAMRPLARALAVAANEEQQIDQQAQQFVRQFQSLERAELFFLSDVCEIDKDVTTKLKAGVEQRAKAAARKFSSSQHRMMRGQGEAAGNQDARTLTQEGVFEALKAEGAPDDLAKYEKQVKLRSEFRKSAAVRNLVAKLDRELVLSETQREKLLEVLKEKWDDAWGRSMQLFIYGEVYYPVIPDAIVLPHLDAMQKEIWRGLPKQQNNIFFNGLGMMGNEIDEFPADDAEAQAAPLIEAVQEVRVIAVDAAPVVDEAAAEEEKRNEP